MTLRRAVVLSSVLAVVAPAATARADDVETCMAAAEQAQTLRAEGKQRMAREKLLVCARKGCPAFVKADCTKWLGEIDEQMPTIIVHAKDASGAEVVDVRVFIDELQVAVALDGRPITADVGEHTIRYERSGSAPVTDHVTLRAGEHGHQLSVTFAGPTPPSTATPTPTPTPTPPPTSTPTSTSTAPDTASRGIPTLSWVLGGVGLAAIAGGAFLWTRGLSDRSGLQDQHAQNPTTCCAQTDIDSAHSKLVLGDVLVGVGVVAAGAAVWIALTSPATTAPSGAALDVRPVPGGGLASYRLRF